MKRTYRSKGNWNVLHTLSSTFLILCPPRVRKSAPCPARGPCTVTMKRWSGSILLVNQYEPETKGNNNTLYKVRKRARRCARELRRVNSRYCRIRRSGIVVLRKGERRTPRTGISNLLLPFRFILRLYIDRCTHLHLRQLRI